MAALPKKHYNTAALASIFLTVTLFGIVSPRAQSSPQLSPLLIPTNGRVLPTTANCQNNDSGTTEQPSSSLTSLRNSAIIFIKPHANNPQVQSLVRSLLSSHSISIVREKAIPGSDISLHNLVEKHYYAIGSKATLLKPSDLPVSGDVFRSAFGEEWSTVLEEDRALNAAGACDAWGLRPADLKEVWDASSRVVKLGGGFYIGRVCRPSSSNEENYYIVNGFFLGMKDRFVGYGGIGVYCYEVEWDERVLSWGAFRGNVLGSTDPTMAKDGSLRRVIFDRYKELGLGSVPNTSDNSVHGSASPFEGLVEQINWMGGSFRDNAFGRALLAKGFSKDILEKWGQDARVLLEKQGQEESIFDALEDLDVGDCLKKMIDIYEINKDEGVC